MISSKKIHIISVVVWCSVGIYQAFRAPQFIRRLITAPELIFTVSFLVVGYALVWRLMSLAGSWAVKIIGWREDTDNMTRAGILFPVFGALAIQLFWWTKSLLPNLSAFSPQRLAALVVILIFATGAGKIAAHVVEKNPATRAPRLGIIDILLLVIFAGFFCILFFLRGWSFHLFESQPHNDTDTLPNVVIITVDTLSANYTSLHGYPLKDTPGLEAIAAKGASFNLMTTAVPVTGPSHATIMTGLMPRTHGMMSNGDLLSARFVTLAEILRAHGYRTAQIVNLAVCSAAGGLEQGFDESFIYNQNLSPVQSLLSGTALFGSALRAWEIFQLHRFQVAPEEENYWIAREWLRKRSREPFFIWFHSYIPHQPYEPPEYARGEVALKGGPRAFTWQDSRVIYKNKIRLSAIQSEEIRKLYIAEILVADKVVSNIVNDLNEAGMSDRTLLIITSDHGEELYEHEYYFGHVRQLYSSVTRVPCIIRYPGRIPPGTKVGAPASLADLFPTVLDFLAIPNPSHTDGKSLAPFLTGEYHTADEQFAVSETNPPGRGIHRIAVQSRDWHYILNITGTIKDELYRASDIFESKDLSASPTSASAKKVLYDYLRDWLSRHPYPPSLNRPVDPAKLKQLKEMGYIY